MPPVDLLRPYPAENMLAWPVGQRVGNVRNNDPELLEHTTATSDYESSTRGRA
jgi:putative SOS response-associated peptidase YedK